MRDDQVFTIHVLIAQPPEERLRCLEIAFEQQQHSLVIAHRHIEVTVVSNPYLTSLSNAPERVVVITDPELAQSEHNERRAGTRLTLGHAFEARQSFGVSGTPVNASG